MDSRLLATLNSQARTATDPVVWARTVCRASAHFARHGMSTQALKAISVVRDHYGLDLEPEVASWLMLAEGVLHYFKAQTKEAYDRIRRAYGLAVALQTESALPICAAWMAHVEFHDCEYIKMSSHLEEALTTAKSDDHPAHARASLVLANAFQLAGSYTLARPWYEKARLRAADDGDNATLSAMLYNVAAFRAANVRLEDTFGFEYSHEANRARLDTASSRHYDHAIGTRGLDFLSLLLRGLIHTINKNYEDALTIFFEIDVTKLQVQMLAPLYADIAWCSANTGSLEQCEDFIQNASKYIDSLSESDDRAYVNSRMSQTFFLLGRISESEQHKIIATAALNEHRKFQDKLLKLLDNIRKQ